MHSAPKNLKGHACRQAGFTLIELLVTTTILSIVFLIGFAGYRDFSRRQQLVSLARQLQGELKNAQQLALTGYKPTNPFCTNLNSVLMGYNLTPSGTSYRVSAICTGGIVDIKTVNLPTGVTITRAYTGANPNPWWAIKTLGLGTNLPAGTEARYTLTDALGQNIVVTLTASGEIK